MNFISVNYCCTGREKKNKGEKKSNLFNVTTVTSNTFSAELFWFYFPSICQVLARVEAEHSCQSQEPTVHLQEGITEEHKFIRVESHSNAFELNVRSEQTMQFAFHQLRGKC